MCVPCDLDRDGSASFPSVLKYHVCVSFVVGDWYGNHFDLCMERQMDAGNKGEIICHCF